jgi:hypothetical protein
VDVFIIDDGRGGHYMPYLADFEGTPEVWNRRAGDSGTSHESAIIGVPNFAYVAVSNRGTKPAAGVVVRGLRCSSARARPRT